MAAHRHHRDSDQASPDSADADQSCRRHIRIGLALLPVPVLACKMQHMQQSLRMMSDMRRLRRLHKRARNSAEWRDAAARRGPAVQKTHAARDVRVRRLRQSVHGICPTCTACAAVRTRARACLSSSVVTRRRPSVGLSRQSLGSTVVAVAVSAAIFIAVTVAVAGIVPARRARFRPCTRRAREVLRRSQGREGPKAEKD